MFQLEQRAIFRWRDVPIGTLGRFVQEGDPAPGIKLLICRREDGERTDVPAGTNSLVFRLEH